MADWRLNGQERILQNATLYRITFPEFWKTSYREKNAFFQRIDREARSYAEEMEKSREFPKGEEIGRFWHAHCAFCWEKATTDLPCTFYSTSDMKHWICEECFLDFKEIFHWKAREGTELG